MTIALATIMAQHFHLVPSHAEFFKKSGLLPALRVTSDCPSNW